MFKENHINIRSLAWHDLITLYRRRDQVLLLDSAALLTRGNAIGLSAMLDYLNPNRGVFTGVYAANSAQEALIGQIQFTLGERAAHLAFLLSDEAPDPGRLAFLLDGLVQKAGELGAYSLVAELPEDSPLFVRLRRAGFVVYGWQQVWQLPNQEHSDASKGGFWRAISSADEFHVRSLYQSLVPSLVQCAEVFTDHQLNGLVYEQNGEISAYVEGVSGPRGFYVNPLIHPSVEDANQLVQSLPGQLQPLMGRPVYLAVRSYQGWLEAVLSQMGAQFHERYALLVKYFTLPQRSAVPAAARAVMENPNAKPAAPIMHHFLEPKSEPARLTGHGNKE